MSEKDCLYVGSLGILKSCDVYKDPPVSSSTDLPDLEKIEENNTVHICTTALPNFFSQMDRIKHKFILVTGDADKEVFSQIFESEEQFKKIIENDKIVHWFAQNCTAIHKKITQIPIGLPYHTKVPASDLWGDQETPKEQEDVVINIKNATKPFYERQIKCYNNFSLPPSFYHYEKDRIEAFNDVPEHLIFKEVANQNRYTCYKNQSDFAFVLSPFGNGMDCHRTWEALIMGCIPIVRSSALNPLFNELPVLFVDKWSDVTQELLDKTVNEFKKKTFNYEKLHLKYWVDMINSHKKENFVNIKAHEQSVFYDLFFYFLTILILILIAFIFIKNYRYLSFVYIKKRFL